MKVWTDDDEVRQTIAILIPHLNLQLGRAKKEKKDLLESLRQ